MLSPNAQQPFQALQETPCGQSHLVLLDQFPQRAQFRMVDEDPTTKIGIVPQMTEDRTDMIAITILVATSESGLVRDHSRGSSLWMPELPRDVDWDLRDASIASSDLYTRAMQLYVRRDGVPLHSLFLGLWLAGQNLHSESPVRRYRSVLRSIPIQCLARLTYRGLPQLFSYQRSSHDHYQLHS